MDIRPWQKILERMAELGLTAEDGLAQVWYVAANGRLYGGAEAVNRVLRHVWWARPFTYLYHLPGMRQLQHWLYFWAARNRRRLPGATAACDLPPGNNKSPQE